MSEPYRGTFFQDGKTVKFYAWRVTRESVKDVAIWCGGKSDSLRYINVDIPFVAVHDTGDRPETATPGDWVVKFSTVSYYRVLVDPVFQTLVRDLGATLVEKPRSSFVRSKPGINVVYDTPRQNHSVIYLETNNEGES